MRSGVVTHSNSQYPGWEEVVEGLWRHESAVDPRVDVVFIHGLGAHWFDTWRFPANAESWMNWLAEQVPTACVHAIDYAVAKSHRDGESMQLIERAKNLLDRLVLELSSDRPLIFVCHSMGGLHLKKMLEIAQRPGAPAKWLALAQRTEGVVFFSTPHQGSPLATWVLRLPRWLLRPTVAIEDLRAHSPHLADLNEVFQNFVHANAVRVHSYYERSPTRVGDWLGRFITVTVVDRDSSNPSIVGAQHICLDGDHSSICQFPKPTAQGYRGVIQFLEPVTTSVPTVPSLPFHVPKVESHPSSIIMSPSARAAIVGYEASDPGIVMPRVPSNLPELPLTIVPRPEITAAIHDAVAAGRGTGVLRQVAATAHGGYGKTIAALLYAHEYADFYPGGRFFLSMEKADLAVQLASLARSLQLTVPDDPPAAAAIVKHALESGARSDGHESPTLLILDNVTDAAHWTAIADSGLLPGGSCRVLVTTRSDTVLPGNAVRVGALTLPQAREVYARFCRDVRDEPAERTADAITRLLGGLAVAVAAVAASARLQPQRSWDDIYRGLISTRVDDLPDADAVVRAELSLDGMALADHRRTLRVIDDALDALPPADLRAVEYAALLPEDMVPAIWLEALLAAEIARAADKDDPLHPGCGV